MKQKLFTPLATALVVASQMTGWTADTSQSSASRDKTAMHEQLRASKLKGEKVFSSSGEELGKVEDVILNKTSGRAEFVILSTGTMGSHKYVPVPWRAITSATDKGLTLNIDKQKLASAPTWDKDHFTGQSPDAVARIYHFYGLEPRSAMGGTSSDIGGSSDRGVSDQPTQVK